MTTALHVLALAAEAYLALAALVVLIIIAALAYDALARPIEDQIPSAELANAMIYGSRHARNDQRDREAA